MSINTIKCTSSTSNHARAMRRLHNISNKCKPSHVHVANGLRDQLLHRVCSEVVPPPAVAIARKPVCLVIGAGAGVGQAVAKKFAREGYHVCVVRRGGGRSSLSDDATKQKFFDFVQGIRDNGGTADAFFGDAADQHEMATIIQNIETNIGPIHVAVYNVGAQFGNRALEKTSYRIFELGFKMGAMGAFIMAKEVTPYMKNRGLGTLIYTSATAAHRGNAEQHAHTAAMGARKHLAQSLYQELAPHGIHVCHVVVDAVIDSPETVGKMMPGLYAHMQTVVANDEVVVPSSVADVYWMLHNQPRNAWTHDMDVRPWTETPWYNS